MRRRQITTHLKGMLAEVAYHDIDGQEVKTLVVDFGQPRRMLSTTCGYRMLRYAANHYIPKPLWEHNLDHLDQYLDRVHRSLDTDQREFATLVTAVDVDNLAYRYAHHGQLDVGCIITSGVKGNALRMGVDRAQVDGFGMPPSHPGTINVIFFTNANLSDAAMAMSLLNITEAKSAVLQDLNVRSVYTPGAIATGTGTDGVIVVSGNGVAVPSTSGHLKIGEMIGFSVREALIEALAKQDGLRPA